MSHKASNLLKAALQLDPDECAELAAHLFEGLDDSVEDDIGTLWDQEIAKRISELECGQVKVVPWSEARQMIFAPDNRACDESNCTRSPSPHLRS